MKADEDGDDTSELHVMYTVSGVRWTCEVSLPATKMLVKASGPAMGRDDARRLAYEFRDWALKAYSEVKAT